MKLDTNNKKVAFDLAKVLMLRFLLSIRTNCASMDGPLGFPVSPFSALHIVMLVPFGWSQGRRFLLGSQISLVDSETGHVFILSLLHSESVIWSYPAHLILL